MYHWKELHNAICKGDEMTTQTTPRSPLEVARQRLEAAQANLAKLEQQAEERANLGQRFADGETVEQLVESTGWSEERVRSALAAAGVLVPKRRKLTPDDMRQAEVLLRGGSSPRTVSDDLNVATSVIMRLAKDLGITQSARKRTPEQMRDLIALEAQMRRIYGAGFAALGEALRKWRAEHGEQPETEEAGVTVALTPEAPPEEPPVEPVVLTPEEQAKMEESDSNDIENWD